MIWGSWKAIACIGSLSMLLSADMSGCAKSASTGSNISHISQISLEELRHQAQGITVKVMSTEFLGSGIILRKTDKVYTVLTNAHVLRAGKSPYRIQTVDGRIYPANLLPGVRFGKHDLALLQFQSMNDDYRVAALGYSPVVGDDVFATGFPFDQEELTAKDFMFTTGKVLLVLQKALDGGYQVGYTNEIAKGMSGGPLLNRRGEVVGINGMHAYPLWDVPSVFIDGLQVDENLHQRINRLSWAVPMDKVVQMIPAMSNKADKRSSYEAR
ncbi:serine protease [Anabaena sp. UHCC 0399]|uniref:S1 family peptidase n=1 Tax=Anabaena sp. UHCC 0399 TaxID=3110238 RepID=UPI002B202820|nr:serine protease [Anabaena sp. UHCC 0399]MEA5568150.1 serine protease [Anabaena sp. UHCC 0399]